MPKSVKHGKQSLLLSKDFALDTEGSKYSDSSSIPKDGFSRLLDLIQVSHNVDENSTYYDHSQLLKRLHVVIFSPDDKHAQFMALYMACRFLMRLLEKVFVIIDHFGLLVSALQHMSYEKGFISTYILAVQTISSL
ncbi:hypothetical protein Syun_012165 [Stephania yunnanensis]|uniref:Uncharacterized protein n=1 Tax=Stephania yunnanensis TaxID=152371 RepID=A0AAP0PIS4_9MAGN